jgi:hypothetical protein
MPKIAKAPEPKVILTIRYADGRLARRRYQTIEAALHEAKALTITKPWSNVLLASVEVIQEAAK